MNQSEDQLRQIIDSIPALVWSARPDGSIDFVNLRWLEYTGLSLQQVLNWGWKIAIHPDDLFNTLEALRNGFIGSMPFEIEVRLRRKDAIFRWFLFRGHPLLDSSGKVSRWYGSNIDIEDRKRTGSDLTSNEQSFLQLANTLPGLVTIMTAKGEVELVNERVLKYFGMTLEELKKWGTNEAVHLEDRAKALAAWTHSSMTGEPYDIESRHRRADGTYRWHNTRAVCQRDDLGRILRWSVLITDIDELKRAEQQLRRSEAYLAEAQKLSRTGSFGWDVASGAIRWSQETFRIFECDPADEVTLELILQRTHPEDRLFVQQLIVRVTEEKQEFDYEQRLLMPDGCVKHLRVMGRPSKDPSGTFEFVGAVMDISERKQAEEALRRTERYLTDGQKLTHTGSWAWQLKSRRFVHWSREQYRIFDFNPAEDLPLERMFFQRIHPEDRREVEVAFDKALLQSEDEISVNHRVVLPEGEVRYITTIGHPVSDLSGSAPEYIGTSIDVTEQHLSRMALETAFEENKVLKEQLYRENLALRDEVDRVSMFEEIVGTSSALQSVLSRVIKVAPTDSSVLVTGETGTGKELIARAIHKRSLRSQRAFVSVNCAALAPSLISSELFGHEKGAFTGAMQRRLGRFELADGGTIFLDEVGELPADVQVSLLRVLQEREFERVGGSRSIPVDVRVIAATNRNLDMARKDGSFRSDLYYRLNVFPIEVPALRDRRDDVLMLLEYFVHRFAKKIGREFSHIDKRTIELFQSYEWPGNIRELQNIVERSVILSTDNVFRVDEAWLSLGGDQISPVESRSADADEERKSEREIIEAALRRSRGRVSGPNGAAVLLRIPPSTLASRIKVLKIPKSRYKIG